MNNINFKNNEGFSLIELLLVILIAGIVFTAASDLFLSGLTLYTKNQEKIEIQRELRFITNYIDENLKYSEKVIIDGIDENTTVNNDQVLIGLPNNDSYITIKENGYSVRNISNTKIDALRFTKKDNDIITLYVQKDNYDLETNILLNNAKLTTSTYNWFVLFSK